MIGVLVGGKAGVKVARAIPRGAAVFLIVLAASLGGCSTLTSTPYYPENWTREQREQWECTRTGGWWRSNIAGGYCEYQTAQFP